MIEIIRQRERVERKTYAVGFHDEHGAGFSYDSDADGNIERVGYWPYLNQAIAGYCDGTYEISIDCYVNRWVEPAVGRCKCGDEIELDGDSDCEKCGRSYNAFGQELRPGYWRNPSNYDDEISDLDGYEMAFAGDE